MNNVIRTHRLSNGIMLLGEEMDAVSSVAVTILVPGGAVDDPSDKLGIGYLLAQMLDRGAGDYDSRALVEEMERYGIHYGNSAGMEATMISASLLSENLEPALRLLVAMIRNPHLPAEDLESVRQLALQELKSVDDEPSSKVMIELSRAFYPEPFGRNQLGTAAGLANVDIDSLKQHFVSQMRAGGTVIGVAGKFVWSSIVELLESLLAGWGGDGTKIPVPPLVAESRVHHLLKETNQVQIALAYPSIGFGHEQFYAARVAMSVLSGGMCGRLFVEVREKRGLVYQVNASHSAARDRAAVFCYAGTTPERAQETLDVMVGELRRLRDGVAEEELARAKADLKARLIMQGELSGVRASSIVNDWWNLGRIRTLDEIKRGIDAVSGADIVRYTTEYPADPITLVVLGPSALELPE